jgi:hypothetical protein
VTELDRAQRLSDLREIFCLTFVKGADDSEALRRMGGYPDTIERRTLGDASGLMYDFDRGYPRMACAVSLGGWSMVVEPDGFHGSDRERITGATVPDDLRSRTFLSAQIEPWFATGAVGADLVRRNRFSPQSDELVAT